MNGKKTKKPQNKAVHRTGARELYLAYSEIFLFGDLAYSEME